MSNLDKEGIEFLNRLYKDMYKSDEVMHGIDERFIGNKIDNIGRYIDRMQELHERVATSGRENDLRMLKEFYYQKYVIKEKDIPESYYEHQKEIAFESGYGHVDLNADMKRQMAVQIINDQKNRLDAWIEYFVSNDSSYIPMWAKYWAFQGMLSLGNYDKQNKTFSKRSKGTISPFVDLNREALALSIDFLLKTLRKEEIDDKQLEVLVQGGSFGKIYSYILTNVLSKNNSSKKSTNGRWVKYSRGTDHMPLVKSLQGYNTGWCTAGEETAKSQLSMGDFYVYYTYNEKGETVVPRIAIRMEGNCIGEVRGVAKDQNIESEMEDVAEAKLSEFPDKDKYKKKVSDMKKLTLIYKKFKRNEELKNEELKFIYEIEEKIEGFGYAKDPRISEILTKRNAKKDLSIVFNCNEEQVGISTFDLDRDLVVFYGDLDIRLRYLEIIKKYPNIMIGNLSFHSFEIDDDLILPKILNGNLYLAKLESAEGLVLPKIINGSLILCSLLTAKGLKLPKRINGGLDLSGLKSAEGLVLPEIIYDYLDLGGLESAKGLVLPEIIYGDLYLSGLESAKGLVLPKIIYGDLDLGGLESAKGLVLPEIIYGDLYLCLLKNAEGLVLPKMIYGDLDLGGLKSIKGLVLPKIIHGDLYLGGLESAEGLVLPEIIHGNLNMDYLWDTKKIKFPKRIDGYLSMMYLGDIEGFIPPEKVGCIVLFNIENLNGIILPENFEFEIIYLSKNVEVTPENIHEYIDKPKSK